MIFAVSNYYRYELVEANSEEEAVLLFSGKTGLVKLKPELADDAVIVAMCCKYDGRVETIFEQCKQDVDRVLLMDALPLTSFYSIG